MALISDETLAKSAGSLYLAPLGTGVPAEADLDDQTALETAGWVHVGWLDEDGPQFEGFEGDNSKHYGWNAVAPVRSITRVTKPMVNVGLLQWNADNLAEFFPGAVFNSGTATLVVPESGNPVEREMLVVIQDGARYIGVWIGKVSNRGGDSFEFPGDGLSVINVVYDVLSTGDPTNLLTFVGIDDAATS